MDLQISSNILFSPNLIVFLYILEKSFLWLLKQNKRHPCSEKDDQMIIEGSFKTSLQKLFQVLMMIAKVTIWQNIIRVRRAHSQTLEVALLADSFGTSAFRPKLIPIWHCAWAGNLSETCLLLSSIQQFIRYSFDENVQLSNTIWTVFWVIFTSWFHPLKWQLIIWHKMWKIFLLWKLISETLLD